MFLVDDYLLSSAKNPLFILCKIIKAKFFPSQDRSGISRFSKARMTLATILFTSGSSGMPKGVMLTHKNILENCRQLYDLELFDDLLMFWLIYLFFHSFGFTVGMIFSVLRRLPLACSPNPLDHKLNLKVIQKEKNQNSFRHTDFSSRLFKASKK